MLRSLRRKRSTLAEANAEEFVPDVAFELNLNNEHDCRE